QLRTGVQESRPRQPRHAASSSRGAEARAYPFPVMRRASERGRFTRRSHVPDAQSTHSKAWIASPDRRQWTAGAFLMELFHFLECQKTSSANTTMKIPSNTSNITSTLATLPFGRVSL